MQHGLVDAEVGVLYLCVLPDERDCERFLARVVLMQEFLPVLHVGRALRRQAELLEDEVVEFLRVQHHRYSVYRVGVDGFEYGIRGDAAEEPYLLAKLRADRVLRAADYHVGLDAYPAQLVDTVLCRLRLELSRRRDVGDERDVAVKNVGTPDAARELANRFEVRQTFDVSDRSAYFGDDDVFVLADALYPVLDFVRDVRYDLHRRAVVAAGALALYDGGIYLSRRAAVFSLDRFVYETFVVAEVEVRLSPVPRYEYFSMLKRAHCSCVYVDIRVHLDDAYLIPAAFQKNAERRGCNSLAER